MRLACSAWLAAALSLGCGAAVTVAPEPGHLPAGPGQKTGPLVDTSDVQTLRLFFANAEGTQSDVTERINRDEPTPLPTVTVDRDAANAVDVWACANKDACVKSEVLLRGCAAFALTHQSPFETAVVPVVLYPVDDARLSCPIVIQADRAP